MPYQSKDMSFQQAVVLLFKINEPRKRKSKVEILYVLKEF